MIGLDNIKRKANEKGITILEALVSTAIIGIGFVAVFQMVQYSIRSIDVSGERTKMNYLVSMVAEDIISDKNSKDANKKGFLKNVTKISSYFHIELNKLQKQYPKTIKEVRGAGLLVGLQLHKDQTTFIKKLMDNKLLTIRAAENVIRLLPPLTVKKNEIDLAISIIGKVCKNHK